MAVVRFWNREIDLLKNSKWLNISLTITHKQKDLKAQTDSFIGDPQKQHNAMYR